MSKSNNKYFTTHEMKHIFEDGYTSPAERIKVIKQIVYARIPYAERTEYLECLLDNEKPLHVYFEKEDKAYCLSDFQRLEQLEKEVKKRYAQSS